MVCKLFRILNKNVKPKYFMLFKCVWRCYAADPSNNSEATWKIHIHDASNEENMLARMARRASVTLRKRRSSRMDSISLSQANKRDTESLSSVFTDPDKIGMFMHASTFNLNLFSNIITVSNNMLVF